jgi:hypothetical protein
VVKSLSGFGTIAIVVLAFGCRSNHWVRTAGNRLLRCSPRRRFHFRVQRFGEREQAGYVR